MAAGGKSDRKLQRPDSPASPRGKQADGTGGQQGGGGGSGGGGSAGGDVTDDEPDDETDFGSVNPLNVHNPLCDERLKPGEERNCENTGSPETRYPTSNYGLEEHIDDSGSAGDTIRGSFQVMLVQIANFIWLAMLFVLNLVMTLVSWAFELNPFSDNQAMREVSDSLERFYRLFTSPWIVVAFVCLGTWAMWKGLIKREVAASIAGMAASALLMIGGLIILHEPRATVGAVAGASDEAAQAVIGAPLNGSASDPTGSYASATRSVWNAMTLPGFAALNFTDVGWALDKPEPEIVEIADESVCADYLYGDTDNGFLHLPSADELANLSKGKCASGARIPPPDSNAEIWLRSSTGSETRQRLWEEITDGTEWAHYLSIQGGGGAWTRLPLTAIIAVGLLGGVLLLGWLALRLLIQSAVAFVMLLATPLALFMPAFGERGRSAFVAWATTLLGALLSKLIYAALLSVVLFTTNTVAALAGEAGGLGTMTAFLVMAGLWWAVFLKREALLSFLQVNPQGAAQTGGGFMGNYMKYRAASALIGAIPGMGPRGGGGGRGGERTGRGEGREEDDDPVSRNDADLDGSAEKRLDAQYSEAEEVLEEARRGPSSERIFREDQALARRQHAIEAAQRGLEAGDLSETELDERFGGTSGSARKELERVRAERERLDGQRMTRLRKPGAEALIADADGRRALRGKRWSAEQIREARDQIRAEADEPVESGTHAWRLGMSKARYEGLGGAEREEAHRKVRAAIRADQSSFGTIADQPKGIVGRAGDRAAGAARRVSARPAAADTRAPRPRRDIGGRAREVAAGAAADAGREARRSAQLLRRRRNVGSR